MDTVNPAVSAWLAAGRGAYALPAEDEATGASDAPKPVLRGAYRPPANDTWGILVALTVILLWAALAWQALFVTRLPPMLGPANRNTPYTPWWAVLAIFCSLEFMYTGLFITTHDAMHGTIAMRHRRWNDLLGHVAISLYAWFDYNMLHRKHWEHHNHTGQRGLDPDFHAGNPAVIPWFSKFMASYSSLWQLVRIAWCAVALQALGVRLENLLLFYTAAPLLSAFRLFYYGTYVPHHPPAGPGASTREMGWTLSRTSTASRLVSFLTCYHFDMVMHN